MRERFVRVMLLTTSTCRTSLNPRSQKHWNGSVTTTPRTSASTLSSSKRANAPPWTTVTHAAHLPPWRRTPWRCLQPPWRHCCSTDVIATSYWRHSDVIRNSGVDRLNVHCQTATCCRSRSRSGLAFLCQVTSIRRLSRDILTWANVTWQMMETWPYPDLGWPKRTWHGRVARSAWTMPMTDVTEIGAENPFQRTGRAYEKPARK